MPGQSDSDLERIRELLEVMRQNDLLELEISHGEDRISLKRAGARRVAERAERDSVQADGAGEAPAPPRAGDEVAEIRSPIVGTLYSAPSPDSDPYVDVGSSVDPQTVVCIVEAMKVMNEIKPDISGTISEVCVKNGQAVEYGQVLFRVTPE
jgi:acetyl-CoA carboxylase biotin carboxyl carrier protein